MKQFFTLSLILFSTLLNAQTSIIKGQLQNAEGEAIPFANIALYSAADSSLTKVETSAESGIFKMQGIPAGTYNLTATYVGVADFNQNGIVLMEDQELDLGVLSFSAASVELEQATVTAQRAIVEIKPDRTVFNVQGTINSTGSDGLELLRKAPGVMLDNNENINVLGRAGVRVFVDGRPLPLSGADLANYLKTLQAAQIDRIDIITNPGAKYEAEGNAGIIDIRLKKDKNHGANGSANLGISKGRHLRVTPNVSGNYRNKKMNVFGTLAYGTGESYHDMIFKSTMNNIYQEETNDTKSAFSDYNVRIGADFFLTKKQTIGFLVNAGQDFRETRGFNEISLAQDNNRQSIDSILVATANADNVHDRSSYNVNYQYDDRKKGQSLNLDLDYGTYGTESDRYQPNRYFDAAKENVLTEIINAFDTPQQIDIYTAKIDYEQNLAGGKLGLGSKVSKVVSDNTFLQFDEINGNRIQNDTFSNNFVYDENVYAGYVTYARPINKSWNLSLGLRAEQTDAQGDLTVYAEHLNDESNPLNYLQWFPNAGLTWTQSRTSVFNLAYGRRINRPDYNVLNPFNNRLSELSYEKGNPTLNPEIVNNIELGWTLKYRYNFKLAYSKTDDQITRLLAPDLQRDDEGNIINPDGDPRSGFISWDNLATQKVYSASASLPLQVNKVWSAFVNLSANYKENKAEYDNGTSIDVAAFSYNIYQQHSITLGKGWKGEVSGWFSGPGIWGGVFEHDESWSLNLGLQRKFLKDKLNVKLSAEDIFYQSGWNGASNFAGLYSAGSGNWDSRRVSLNLNYLFGNQNVKSRKRKAGLEDEAGRVSN